MTALAFLIRHRTVDLVAGSAARSMRDDLGLGDRLLELRRDDAFVLEGMDAGSGSEWAEACIARADWCNPNTHRHAFYQAHPGALAASEGEPWPHPWLNGLVETDRSDLAEASDLGDLDSWLALARQADAYAVSLAAWEVEGGLRNLPKGSWPASSGRVLRFDLWSMALRADGPEAARDLAMDVAVTRGRGQGLLIHPHIQRWALVAEPWSLEQGAMA